MQFEAIFVSISRSWQIPIYAKGHIQFNYANVVDMFPPTDSAKNAMDMFPRTDISKDIRSILSSHIENVALLKLNM